MERKEKAKQLFLDGYNCCQSVVASCCDLINLDFDQAVQISSCFGGGIGGMRGKCGAVTGMFMVLGMVNGGYDPNDNKSKKELYDMVRILDKDFEQRFETTNCAELLKNSGVIVKQYANERNMEYYSKRPCAIFVEAAIEILQKRLICPQD